MKTSEYEELKKDVHEIKGQLNQIVNLLQILVDNKNENEHELKNKPTLESIINNDNDEVDNSNKYIIRRKKKDKKKRNYEMEDLVANHTIIKKEVLKDLETKGFSDVKRYEDEEETKPINDPIHVQILYNFGFVLDKNHDKYNAILLLSNICNYNVIHINVVKKLNLEIMKINNPFVIRTSVNKFESNEYVTLTLAVNIDKTTNKMFTSEFVVTHLEHYNDMIEVNFSTLRKNEVHQYGWYEFEEIDNTPYIF